ncbi:MAG: AN1-type zinc finger domain-containing protein [Nitrososphaerota archaeon]
MRCSKCGAEEVLPFKCAYCGEQFCSKHRLPESHDCRAIYLARSILEIERREARPQEGSPRSTTMLAVRAEMLVSRLTAMEKGSEVVHMAGGAGIVAAVAFSMVYHWAGLLGLPLLIAVIMGVVGSFIAHELAHKLEAIRQGHWARFRLNLIGSIISLISILLPLKFIAPGAVVILGPVTHRGVSKISAVGPLVNLVIAGVLLAVIYVAYSMLGVLDYALSIALLLIGHLNSLMGLINLIPISPLDGLKIITASFRSWASYMAVAVVLFLAYYFRLPLI